MVDRISLFDVGGYLFLRFRYGLVGNHRCFRRFSIERVSLKLRDRSTQRVNFRMLFQEFQLFFASVRRRKIVRIHPCDPLAGAVLESFVQRFPETAVFRKADYAKDYFLVVVFLSLTFLRIFSLYLAFLTSISLLIVFR